MKKSFKQLVSCALTVALAVTSVIAPPCADTTQAASADPKTTVTSSTKLQRVSVHDPSITETADGYYYAFGSHIQAARSKDLVNWTSFANGYAITNNKIFGNLDRNGNLKKAFDWAGYPSDTDDGTYHIWAPDVFWNKDYVNADGSTGAYMMYFCTTSDGYRSVVAYGISQNIEGPYDMVDTIVYSGFINNTNGNASYTRTNIPELINNGTLKDGLNEKWFDQISFNTSYMPNCIDPTVFYDKDDKLWMTYGSYRGGIFVLEIDPKTGAAKYPGKNSTTEDGRVIDEYFGTKIAGGYNKSCEGPYILYDRDSDYYYLYVSYNWLGVDGGYNMRLFRSKNPDGPYEDAAGNNAVLTSATVNHNDIGIKVMGNHKFSTMTRAYKAPGHNSALVDEDGNRYLIYHTRFSDRGEINELRVHQQFINENGWPVTAVFENKGDSISQTGYDKDLIIGDYEFINHGIQSDGASVINSKNITLKADGTISGSVTGTWTAKDGTCYMDAVISGVTYSGVFFLQHDESEECNKVMTFTAIGSDNKTIWGVKKDTYKYTDNEAIERVKVTLDDNLLITSKTLDDISLPTSGYQDTKIAWSSSNTSVITNDGKVTRPAEDTEVTLTATLTHGSVTETKTYTTTVLSANLTPDYRYDFESVTDKKAASTGKNTTEATLQGSASVTSNTFAGNVLTIKNSSGTNGGNYLALPSDAFKNVDASGFTVSMWAKCSSVASMASALFEAKSPAGTGSLPAAVLYAGCYGAFSTSDTSASSSIGLTPESNTWNLITYTVSANGVTVYINGTNRSEKLAKLEAALSAENMAKISDIRIGSGSVLNSENVTDASIDNVDFYSVALNAKEIAAKYEAEKDNYPNLSLSASRSTIYSGGDTNKTASLSVSCSTSLDYTTAYSSSDTSVATVSASGTVTAKKAGTATITATLSSGDKTQTLTKKITVKKAYLALSKKKTSIKKGKSFTFKAKGYGLKANSIKWSSSKPSVLSIKAGTGVAKAKKAGTATITAKYKSSKVSVKVKVTK